MPIEPENLYLSVLLLSDSTGETVQAVARAALSQFVEVDVKYKVEPFIRTEEDAEQISSDTIFGASLIAYTIVDPKTRAAIEARAAEAGVPTISLLDPLIDGISKLVGRSPASRPGRQYQVDDSYLDRVAAIEFAVNHDDGLSEDYLLGADVILVGVSRTSKTPTCIYLGYQGIKAANVPLIYQQDPPDSLLTAMASGVPTVGLVASASRLVQIRQSRLNALGARANDLYSDRRTIEEELIAARLLFERHDVPVIDVTRRSIEETAASIRHILSERDQ